MCREVFIIIILLAVSIALTILGALGKPWRHWYNTVTIHYTGPPLTLSEEFSWEECDVAMTTLGEPFITNDNCHDHGRPVNEGSSPQRSNHLYYVTLPIKRSHRQLSRWHQYLLVDFNLEFKNKYLKKVLGEPHPQPHPCHTPNYISTTYFILDTPILFNYFRRNWRSCFRIRSRTWLPWQQLH